MLKLLLGRISKLVLAGACLLPALTKAQTQDTLSSPDNFWQRKGVRISVIPVSLLIASGLTWGEREEVRKLRNRYIPDFRHHFDDYLQYVPAAAVFGLNAAGVKGKHSVPRALVSYAFSAVIMGITVNSIKYTAKVERPDGSSRNSFPSGHTANSFMNATFLHKEYGQYRHPLYSLGAFALSTTTAVGRQLNNRHWISDVLAGAGIGILSTELGYIIADRIFKDRGVSPPRKFDPYPTKENPSFLEVQLGAAFATSRDLTKRADNVRAKRGFNMGLEGAWFFSRNIGVGGQFAFSSFPMSSDRLKFDDPDIPLLSDGYYTQPMGIRYLTIGPFFSLPMPNNWFITGKLNAGSSVGAQGNILLELRDEYIDIFEARELPYLRYKPETAFCWTAGVGIQKRIGRNTALKFYTSYFDSDHDFDLDVLSDVDAQGKYVFKPLTREKVMFNHLAFGLALTAFLW
jgi:membrane-associated phospholipid phosphatase